MIYYLVTKINQGIYVKFFYADVIKLFIFILGHSCYRFFMKNYHLLFKLLIKQNIKISTAESCTGGMLAALLTSKSGSSIIFDRGFITYSNQAKIDILNIDSNIIDHYGAVSEEVSKLMAYSTLKNSRADIALSITGIAGPKSDESLKPVGLVYISSLFNDVITCKKYNFIGNRNQIRTKAVESAIDLAIKSLLTSDPKSNN